MKRAVGRSILDAIGGTPLINLARLTRDVPGRILAKLDYLSPGLSKKDRIALQMIEDAERYGLLAPDQPVVEVTSGNTGIGLALVCAVKSHQFIAVMSRGNSGERVRMMEAFGAEVILVDQAEGFQPNRVSGDDLERVDRVAAELTESRHAYRPNQFSNTSNSRAHELYTGQELWQQAAGEIDAFCEFVGTGGTFAGVAAALKARRPDIRCYVVEPTGAAALSGETVIAPGHRIQGGGYSRPALELLDSAQVDGFLNVTDQQAIAMAQRLAREEGIFAGFSSGANVSAALQLLRERHRGQSVAVILADSGLKYLSTDLWRSSGQLINGELE